MLKQISIILLLLLAAFNLDAAAQRASQATAVRRSVLTGVNFPSGALRIKKSSVPKELKELLAKTIEAAGNGITQGDSEVVMWSGKSVSRTGSANLMKTIEANLKAEGWRYEAGVSEETFVVFSLLRDNPRRGLLGFFFPTATTLTFAVTEMIAPVKNAAVISEEIDAGVEDNAQQIDDDFDISSAGLPNLIGKWESPNLTNITLNNYGSLTAGDSVRYGYEFFADGTVVKTEIGSSIGGACQTESVIVSRGKITSSVYMLTVDFEPATLKFNASCEKPYEKTLPARTEAKSFRFTNKASRKQLCIGAGEAEICMNPAN